MSHVVASPEEDGRQIKSDKNRNTTSTSNSSDRKEKTPGEQQQEPAATAQPSRGVASVSRSASDRVLRALRSGSDSDSGGPTETLTSTDKRRNGGGLLLSEKHRRRQHGPNVASFASCPSAHRPSALPSTGSQQQGNEVSPSSFLVRESELGSSASSEEPTRRVGAGSNIGGRGFFGGGHSSGSKGSSSLFEEGETQLFPLHTAAEMMCYSHCHPRAPESLQHLTRSRWTGMFDHPMVEDEYLLFAGLPAQSTTRLLALVTLLCIVFGINWLFGMPIGLSITSFAFCALFIVFGLLNQFMVAKDPNVSPLARAKISERLVSVAILLSNLIALTTQVRRQSCLHTRRLPASYCMAGVQPSYINMMLFFQVLTFRLHVAIPLILASPISHLLGFPLAGLSFSEETSGYVAGLFFYVSTTLAVALALAVWRDNVSRNRFHAYVVMRRRHVVVRRRRQQLNNTTLLLLAGSTLSTLREGVPIRERYEECIVSTFLLKDYARWSNWQWVSRAAHTLDDLFTTFDQWREEVNLALLCGVGDHYSVVCSPQQEEVDNLLRFSANQIIYFKKIDQYISSVRMNLYEDFDVRHQFGAKQRGVPRLRPEDVFSPSPDALANGVVAATAGQLCLGLYGSQRLYRNGYGTAVVRSLTLAQRMRSSSVWLCSTVASLRNPEYIRIERVHFFDSVLTTPWSAKSPPAAVARFPEVKTVKISSVTGNPEVERDEEQMEDPFQPPAIPKNTPLFDGDTVYKIIRVRGRPTIQQGEASPAAQMRTKLSLSASGGGVHSSQSSTPSASLTIATGEYLSTKRNNSSSSTEGGSGTTDLGSSSGGTRRQGGQKRTAATTHRVGKLLEVFLESYGMCNRKKEFERAPLHPPPASDVAIPQSIQREDVDDDEEIVSTAEINAAVAAAEPTNGLQKTGAEVLNPLASEEQEPSAGIQDGLRSRGSHPSDPETARTRPAPRAHQKTLTTSSGGTQSSTGSGSEHTGEEDSKTVTCTTTAPAAKEEDRLEGEVTDSEERLFFKIAMKHDFGYELVDRLGRVLSEDGIQQKEHPQNQQQRRRNGQRRSPNDEGSSSSSLHVGELSEKERIAKEEDDVSPLGGPPIIRAYNGFLITESRQHCILPSAVAVCMSVGLLVAAFLLSGTHRSMGPTSVAACLLSVAVAVCTPMAVLLRPCNASDTAKATSLMSPGTTLFVLMNVYSALIIVAVGAELHSSSRTSVAGATIALVLSKSAMTVPWRLLLAVMYFWNFCGFGLTFISASESWPLALMTAVVVPPLFTFVAYNDDRQRVQEFMYLHVSRLLLNREKKDETFFQLLLDRLVPSYLVPKIIQRATDDASCIADRVPDAAVVVIRFPQPVPSDLLFVSLADSDSATGTTDSWQHPTAHPPPQPPHNAGLISGVDGEQPQPYPSLIAAWLEHNDEAITLALRRGGGLLELIHCVGDTAYIGGPIKQTASEKTRPSHSDSAVVSGLRLLRRKVNEEVADAASLAALLVFAELNRIADSQPGGQSLWPHRPTMFAGRGDAVALVLGHSPPRFDLMGWVYHTTQGLVNAAPDGFQGVTQRFHEGLPSSREPHLIPREGTINQKEVTAEDIWYNDTKKDVYARHASLAPGTPSRWRIRARGQVYVLPLSPVE